MTTKLAEQHNSNSPKTNEVHIQIIERDGEQLLIIKEQRADDQTKEYSVEIPASLLPELKRAVEEIAPAGDDKETDARGTKSSQQSVAFAHESEEEFAHILDFYHIRWDYEPRTFVLERDGDGNVLKCFTPDFYLPDHDLFIEITTLKQSLVTKKNRKVRLLKELYPDVNIKLLYASDYAKLLEKFSASKFRQDAGTANNKG
jgi:hypothetical protein